MHNTIFLQDIQFILSKGNPPKICIFDDETHLIFSNLIPKTIFIKNNFFIFDKITNLLREKCGNTTCFIIIRPKNYHLLIEELKNQFYEKYIIIFTNEITDENLKEIACADINGLIENVFEVYVDLVEIDDSLFTINGNYKKELYKEIMFKSSSQKVLLENKTHENDMHHKNVYISQNNISSHDKSKTTIYNANNIHKNNCIYDNSYLERVCDGISSLLRCLNLDCNFIVDDEEYLFEIAEKVIRKNGCIMGYRENISEYDENMSNSETNSQNTNCVVDESKPSEYSNQNTFNIHSTLTSSPQNNLETYQVDLQKQGVCILLHRSFDTITPFLNTWTFQSMLHEYLKISNNLINLTKTIDLKSISIYQNLKFMDINEATTEIRTFVNNLKKVKEKYNDNIPKTFNQNASKTTINVNKSNDNIHPYNKSKNSMCYDVLAYDSWKKSQSDAENLLTIQNTILEKCFNLKDLSEHEYLLIKNNKHDLKNLENILKSDLCDIYKMKTIAITILKSNFDRKIIEWIQKKYIEKLEVNVENKLNDNSNLLKKSMSKSNYNSLIINLMQQNKNKQYSSKFIEKKDIKLGYIPPIVKIIDDCVNKKKLKKDLKIYYIHKNMYKKIVVYVSGGITYQEYCAIKNYEKDKRKENKDFGIYVVSDFMLRYEDLLDTLIE